MLINYIRFSKKHINRFKTILDNVLNGVISELNLTNELEVNLFLTNKRVIKVLNKNTRGINKATDVLSYPNLKLTPKDSKNLHTLISKENFKNDIVPDTNNIFLGDIMLCYPIIKKQAKKYGNTLEREMAYMTVHGILHLLGHDHEKETDKKQMRKIEETVLSKLNLSRD